MAMQTVYLKEHEGIVHNSSVGQFSSVNSAPWWSGFGSQSGYGGDSCGQMKPFSLELSNYIDQLAPSKQLVRGVEQLLDKGHANQFTIFPDISCLDDCKMSGGDAQNHQATLSLQSSFSVAEPRNHFELGFNQPMICAKYPYMDQFYGLFSTYGPQISGRIMLPLSLTPDDGPTYVNAKQYHGIIRRRQSRAKAELQNKLIKRRQPYMHESRHLHAMRRPRGCGGRFLNTRKSTNGNGKNGFEMKQKSGGQQLQSGASQSSEVLQSDVVTLNSSKETNGGSQNVSGSEVTSMYSHSQGVGLDNFTINHLGSAVHSLADMIDSGHGIGHGMDMPTKWFAAAGRQLLQP